MNHLKVCALIICTLSHTAFGMKIYKEKMADIESRSDALPFMNNQLVAFTVNPHGYFKSQDNEYQIDQTIRFGMVFSIGIHNVVLRPIIKQYRNQYYQFDLNDESVLKKENLKMRFLTADEAYLVETLINANKALVPFSFLSIPLAHSSVNIPEKDFVEQKDIN